MTLTASIRPSGATASTVRPSASRSIAWASIELTRISSVPVNPFQQPAGRQADGMDFGVLLIPRAAVVGPVIQLARQFLDPLMQCAAERHVQLLYAPADGEDRHSRFQRRPDQGQGGGVALKVVQGALRAGGSAVVLRFHIGRAAGDQQSVETCHQTGGVQRFAERRDHQRDGSGPIGYGADVFVARDMERMMAQLPDTGGNSDERDILRGHGRGNSGKWLVCYRA